MKKIFFIVAFFLTVFIVSCNTENTAINKIIVKKIIFCESYYESSIEIPLSKSSYILTIRVRPAKILSIEGNKLFYYKRDRYSEIESLFVSYLNNTIIEKINKGLTLLDYKNKNENNLIDSSQLFGGSFRHPYTCLLLEFDNKKSYYWRFISKYYKKDYKEFVNIFKDLETQAELKYIKDASMLNDEKNDIVKLYEDSLCFGHLILPANKKHRKFKLGK